MPRKPRKVSDSVKTDAYPKKRGFLAAYGATANLRAAARAVGIDHMTHYDWLKTDEAYRAAWEHTQEQAAQTCEDEAVRRAVEGDKRIAGFYKGKPIKQGRRILYVREYSDQLLTLLLKRFRPQLYREHISTEITGVIDIAERIQQGKKRLIEMRAVTDASSAAGD
ncbi:MAG: hypothetical protein C5B60_05380 [Chloroflexi bacterium]|nr:MAG: hypothetical protein C5B60_05380 [Chloroflexota bacterium]